MLIGRSRILEGTAWVGQWPTQAFLCGGYFYKVVTEIEAIFYALDIAAQLNHETQALSDDLDIGLRQGEGHERELSALGQVAGETVDADSFAASPFQRDNNDISNRVSRSEPDRVEVTREAQQRLLQ